MKVYRSVREVFHRNWNGLPVRKVGVTLGSLVDEKQGAVLTAAAAPFIKPKMQISSILALFRRSLKQPSNGIMWIFVIFGGWSLD
ncbi:hypothetical protein [Paenibacillus phytorum]|uniref:hypothetical protein n=1 Tax=Paenibacillus phytorum TaxID=2654977 RepID=UPI0035E458B8